MSDPFPVEFVESLFDSLGDIVFCVKDRDGRYRSVNQAFVARVNVSDKSEIVGKRASDFFPKALTEIYEAHDNEVFTECRAIQDRLERITHHDGSMGWFLASKYPILSKDGQATGLVGVSQDLHTPSDSELELANLRTIVKFIKNNLDSPLRTDQLAEKVDLTGIQLDRRMKRVFRLSTKKFIMKCRIEEASRRLATTADPLADIALACGFSDQSAFTRQFRTASNMPPLSYRKKHSSTNE